MSGGSQSSTHVGLKEVGGISRFGPHVDGALYCRFPTKPLGRLARLRKNARKSRIPTAATWRLCRDGRLRLVLLTSPAPGTRQTGRANKPISHLLQTPSPFLHTDVAWFPDGYSVSPYDTGFRHVGIREQSQRLLSY